MYLESEWSKYWKHAVVLLFVALVLPYAWLPELSESEALSALTAQDVISGDNHLVQNSRQAQVQQPPLNSWLISLIYRILPPGELATRLIGIISLGLLAGVCAYVSGITAGPRAAAASAVAVISSYIALKNGISGNPDMLFALLINMSWFVWYFMSREKRRWMFAWFFAHLFVFLAFMTGGMKALFFFYFPLIWLRRPLKIWLRMRQFDHVASLGALIVAILLWIFIAPYQLDSLLKLFREFEYHEPKTTYLIHLLSFPFRFGWNYFPWILLVWPAYCMAFIPLEKDSILCQFLRTLTLPIFYFYWLCPEIDFDILLPLVGPLSVQVGLHYELLVRRHGKQLLLIPKILTNCTLCGLVLSGPIILVLYPDVFNASNIVIGFAVCFIAASVLGAIAILRQSLNFQIWLAVAAAVAVFQLGFAGTFGLVSHEMLSSKRVLGTRLTAGIPSDATIFVMVSEDRSFAGESYYLKRSVVPVRSVDEFPVYEDTIYVLGSIRAPIYQDRHWIAIGKPVKYGDVHLRMWKGEKRLVDIVPERVDFRLNQDQTAYENSEIRIEIINRLPNPLDIVKLESKHNLVVLPDPTGVLRARGTYEFRIRVADSAPLKKEAKDSVTVTIANNKQVFTRTVDVVIRAHRVIVKESATEE